MALNNSITTNNYDNKIYLVNLRNKTSELEFHDFNFSSNDFVKIGKYYRHPKYILEILNKLDDNKYMLISGYTGEFECEIQISLTGKCLYKNNENEKEALKREIHEEMGLLLKNYNQIKNLNKLTNKKGEKTLFSLVKIKENTFIIPKFKNKKCLKQKDNRKKRVASILYGDLDVLIQYMMLTNLPANYCENITYIGAISIRLCKKILIDYLSNPCKGHKQNTICRLYHGD